MTTNREVLLHDPAKTTIPNLGVAKLGQPQKPDEWDVLRYEVQRFVCDGEYHRGLDTILSTFLSRLGQGQQPAVWVSGFFGSGKSHFVRVLDSLWRNIEFPDGAQARGLVNVPEEIAQHLRELSTAGKRQGGLWSASGTLSSGAGTSVRLAMLSIVFGAAGLPSEYPPAKFVLWLKKDGHHDALAAAVTRRGKDLEDVLKDMYVSAPLAEALLEVIPDFATDVAAVHSLLAQQYPVKADLSGEEFVSTLDDVLSLQSSSTGKLPLTLLVFDELQQFLASDSRRILEVQEIVQDCTARFDSRVLFVATGQMALAATSDLQRLQDRFSVKVALSDADVEKVVREVVLRKDPGAVPQLRSVLEKVSGEIGKHLGGTAIAASAADATDLVADYPLLPTRRRFWEALLRSGDPTGTKGQLRAQLAIVHEATAAVADYPLGWVIPADAIYWSLESFLLQNGVLPREVATIIRGQQGLTTDGPLRARVCALVFLIGKLETQGVGTSGVKATIDTLGDLLVEDLNAGSAPLRHKLPEVVQALVDDSLLLPVGDEFRLQTKESQEWEQEFRKHFAGISNDPARISDTRSSELRGRIGTALASIKAVHGASKVTRKIELYFGNEAPPKGVGGIPVWVRDGWSASESAVREAAQQAGVDSPVVFVFVPRPSGDDLAKAIAGQLAAATTITSRPSPTTEEGRDARAALESRRRSEGEKVALQVEAILKQARVFQGGGNEVALGTLIASVGSAVDDAKARLFPKFGIADHSGWGKARELAHGGSATPLLAVGHAGDADQHPVCKLVRDFVGPSGKRGGDIRKEFMAGEYGWQQDAVDGALLALVAGGFMRAKLNGLPVTARQIPANQIGTAEFWSEGVVVQLPHRLAIRKLASSVHFALKNGEEAEAIRPILDRLIDLAARAGGDAPVAARPDTKQVQDLISLAGNEQFVAVADHCDVLIALHAMWSAREHAIAERLDRWQQLQRLIGHAASLGIVAEVQPRADAIRSGRTLLDNPDPVGPLMQDLCSALREAITEARDRLAHARDVELASLEKSADWVRLTETDRAAILATAGLGPVPDVQVGDPHALLRTLDAYPLKDWEEKLIALPGRIANARELAARKLQPTVKSVNPVGATLTTVSEADAYLAALREEIVGHLDAGSPVVIV